MNNTDLIKSINDIRKYFSGMDLTIEQVIEMYIRGDFKDNILINSNAINNKKLVKRKYI